MKLKLPGKMSGQCRDNHVLTISGSLVDQVTGEALEEVRKKQEAVRENIKHLDGELEVVEGEIKDLESDLADVIVKRDKAYMRIQELRKQCDDSVLTCLSFCFIGLGPYYQARFYSYYWLLNFRTASTIATGQCLRMQGRLLRQTML